MPLPVLVDTYRVTLNWLSSTRAAHNVMHIVKSGAVDTDAVWTGLDATVTADMWKHTHNGSQIWSVDILPLDGISSTVRYTTGAPTRWKGTGSTNADMVNTCATVKLQTGFQGRERRGRLFLPFVDEANYLNGFLDSTIIASMQAAWNQFQTDLAALGTPLVQVVASYKLEQIFVVTNYVVPGVASTQRRRTRQLA